MPLSIVIFAYASVFSSAGASTLSVAAASSLAGDSSVFSAFSSPSFVSSSGRGGAIRSNNARISPSNTVGALAFSSAMRAASAAAAFSATSFAFDWTQALI